LSAFSVNEALEEDGTLRRSPWMEAIGPDYIAKAFEYAHEADPAAELYYNDFNLWKPEKAAGAVRIVQQLKERGLRIDAVGEEGHWLLDSPPLAAIEAAITTIASTGVKTMLTELDVDVFPWDPASRNATPAVKARIRAATNIYRRGLPPEKQRELAQRYADAFALVLKHKDQIGRVTFWGVTDAQSWRNEFPIPGRTNYPLLWDRASQPKPAFDAVVEVLRSRGK
jgi:endo-1,4-beta-xylanase